MIDFLLQVTPPTPIQGPAYGDQYRGYGWFGIFFTGIIIFFILYNIKRAQRGKPLYIRRIAGLNAIDEAIGRATEMGRPVLMVPGLSDTVNAIVVQALNIFAYVCRKAAQVSNPILLCCYSAGVYTLAQEIIRDVYAQEGVPEKFDADSVRFISDRQFAFAAGVSGLILRQQTAATFFLGEFYAESLIFAETANSIGAIQVASSTEPTQTPFFIAACDYVLIGDEFYAASAYLTRQPVLVGSLVGQDWAKMLIIATIALGAIYNGIHTQKTVTSEMLGGKEKTYSQPQKASLKSSFIKRVLAGEKDEDVKVERPIDPDAPKEEANGGGGA
ncbi:MAG: hypothetical protein C4320_01315 [Armatimonadota bacterium]